MTSKNKDRLYVTGPPGSGKTSFFLWYATVWAAQNNQRCLMVQYRHLGEPCEILIVDDNKIQRVVLPQIEGKSNNVLTSTDLYRYVQRVVVKEKHFDFFVHDGVRQKHDTCSLVVQILNGSFSKPGQRGMHITSLQFSIKGGDGRGESIDYMSIDSWKQLDYVSALRCADFKTNNEKRMILEEEDVNAIPNNNNKVDDKYWAALIERKFYYAGGSARFVFDYSLHYLVTKILKKLLEQMNHNNLWDEFAQLTIRPDTNSTVNTLVQIFSHDVFPVSKYILVKAYEHGSRSQLVRAVNAAAETTDNTALKGWVFELDRIDTTRRATEFNHPAI